MALKKIQPFNLDTTQAYTFNGATLGAVANVHISGGTAGQVLKTDGTGNLAWTSGAGIGYTTGTTPPATALKGDQWYNTTTNVLYEYINDGTANYWVDIQTPSISASAATTTTVTSTAAKAMVMGLIFGG
jgi:hypothetical protein